jgi:methyltransferase-like protein
LLAEDLEEMVTHLCQHAKFLDQLQRERLHAAILLHTPKSSQTMAAPETTYNASFDLGDEVEQQIRAVRAIRAQVFDANGNMRADISSREAKEVISTGSTMLATLMKYHEKVQNMERLRKLELSVMEALTEISPELQEKALALLEEKLLADEIT